MIEKANPKQKKQLVEFNSKKGILVPGRHICKC
jgi:hypothetical protein